MSDAVIDKTIISIVASNIESSTFQSRGQLLKFDGYLKVQKNLNSSSGKEKLLPKVIEGEKLTANMIVVKKSFQNHPLDLPKLL